MYISFNQFIIQLKRYLHTLYLLNIYLFKYVNFVMKPKKILFPGRIQEEDDIQ